MSPRVLLAGVLDTGSHAVDLGCGGQLCSDRVSWHIGACHWLHGMHVFPVEHECAVKQPEQKASLVCLLRFMH